MFFKVSAEWMAQSGHGDEAKTFRVVEVEQDSSMPEYDVMILETAMGNWRVFRIRGHVVRAFVLIVQSGHFYAQPAHIEDPAGSIRIKHMEFDTKAEAQQTAAELSAALHLAVVADLKTAEISTVKKGSIVRRLYKTGLPMLKEYTVDAFDRTSDCYALLDGKGKVFWLRKGEKVAL